MSALGHEHSSAALHSCPVQPGEQTSKAMTSVAAIGGRPMTACGIPLHDGRSCITVIAKRSCVGNLKQPRCAPQRRSCEPRSSSCATLRSWTSPYICLQPTLGQDRLPGNFERLLDVLSQSAVVVGLCARVKGLQDNNFLPEVQMLSSPLSRPPAKDDNAQRRQRVDECLRIGSRLSNLRCSGVSVGLPIAEALRYDIPKKPLRSGKPHVTQNELHVTCGRVWVIARDIERPDRAWTRRLQEKERSRTNATVSRVDVGHGESASPYSRNEIHQGANMRLI